MEIFIIDTQHWGSGEIQTQLGIAENMEDAFGVPRGKNSLETVVAAINLYSNPLDV